MTTAQLFKYRAEWSKAWRVLRVTPGAVREGQKERDVRMRWHLLIGAVYLRGPDAGRPKSSTVLTNREFDRFLQRCAATHSPASLDAQLALDAQPMLRLRFATDPLFDRIGFSKNDDKRAAYLSGIYYNLQRPAAAAGGRVFAVEEMPDDGALQAVVIALAHTIKHKLGEAHGHPHSQHVSGARARSKFTHRVGAHARKVEPAAPPRTVPHDTAAADHAHAADAADDENDWPF
jgi:hypothetical protein